MVLMLDGELLIMGTCIFQVELLPVCRCSCPGSVVRNERSAGRSIVDVAGSASLIALGILGEPGLAL